MDSLDIRIDRERRLIRVTAVGKIFKADGEQIVTIARTKAAEYGFDIFYDMRQTITNVPIFEWFNLPRTLEVFKDPKARHIKAAVLISKNDAIESYKFYETVTFNLGFMLKIFFDEAETLEWLAHKPKTSR